MHSNMQPQPHPVPNSKWRTIDEHNHKIVVRVERVENNLVHYTHHTGKYRGQRATLNIELFIETFEKGV